MSGEIVFTPLTGRGTQLMEALETKTGKRPYRTDVVTGVRTYSLEGDSRDAGDFDRTLDQIEPTWREHLTRTE